MRLFRVDGMAAADVAALAPDRAHDGFFRLRLRGPTLLVGRKSQISVSDDDHGFRHVFHCYTVTRSTRAKPSSTRGGMSFPAIVAIASSGTTRFLRAFRSRHSAA